MKRRDFLTKGTAVAGLVGSGDLLAEHRCGRAGLLRGHQAGQRRLERPQLLDFFEGRGLGQELRRVHRVVRVLVLELSDEQLQKGVGVDAIGAEEVGGRAGPGAGAGRVPGR